MTDHHTLLERLWTAADTGSVSEMASAIDDIRTAGAIIEFPVLAAAGGEGRTDDQRCGFWLICRSLLDGQWDRPRRAAVRADDRWLWTALATAVDVSRIPLPA